MANFQFGDKVYAKQRLVDPIREAIYFGQITEKDRKKGYRGGHLVCFGKIYCKNWCAKEQNMQCNGLWVRDDLCGRTMEEVAQINY